MTNDEAIYVLKNTAWLGAEEQAEKVSEAVRMAIEALKTQLPKEDTTSDCISRQAVIDICNNVIDLWEGQLGEGALVAIKNAINNLPSVQPETCEGCKHLDKWENEVEYGYPSPCTRCKRRVEDHYER